VSIEVDLMIGLGIMFGLSIIFTFLTYQNIVSFLSFSLLFSGFVVWAGLVPSWVLTLNLIILITVIFYKAKQQRGGMS